MGKNLKKADLVKRTGKMSFFGVGSSVSHTFTRMEGFTEITTAKNANEYERQYTDEDSKRTDVTGYNTSKSYAFDRYKGNAVHDDIINITENELSGQDAVREIVTVDMTTVTEGNGRYYADAYRRQYAVIPDSDGDSMDCMTYSGTFKAHGEQEKIQVSSSTADWQTCYAGLDTDIPLLNALTVTGAAFTEPSAFSANTFYYQMNATAAKATLNATAGSNVTMTYMVNGVNVTSLNNITLNVGTNSVVITLNRSGVVSTYAITITKAS